MFLLHVFLSSANRQILDPVPGDIAEVDSACSEREHMLANNPVYLPIVLLFESEEALRNRLEC